MLSSLRAPFPSLLSIICVKFAFGASEQTTMIEPHDLFNNETITAEKVTSRKRICLVGGVAEDQEIVLASKTFNVPVITSGNGADFINDDTWTTYFILAEFEGSDFDKIYRSKVKHK